ncbi:hypothetical protein B4123_3904 [Bacillus paralicheniformis]|jgi:hypothetical protein|nr:hypothetical protein LI7559_06175 [Bacillus licheniformis LMG 7559]KUL16667.1 hypothetical protein LI6934_14570 [Bacillus licheniformis LMG 6934]OLG05617.1 hypothetical protein B4123_3904 [Bacillus paralicheniformis]TWJ52599.1 hypothetical protein CHCC5023_3892 [Bacillus paralicheniformis]TWJ63011.1 hypothetical protein CHCC5021_1471 [Bacillus paralicheniformis]
MRDEHGWEHNRCRIFLPFVSMPDHVSRQRKSGMEETKEDVIWQTKPQEK